MLAGDAIRPLDGIVLFFPQTYNLSEVKYNSFINKMAGLFYYQDFKYSLITT